MPIADAPGLPVAIWAGTTNTHEARPIEETLNSRFIRSKPDILIGDQAYESNPLDERLKRKGIRMVSPHKRNRKRKKTQEGRTLRR